MRRPSTLPSFSRQKAPLMMLVMAAVATTMLLSCTSAFVPSTTRPVTALPPSISSSLLHAKKAKGFGKVETPVSKPMKPEQAATPMEQPAAAREEPKSFLQSVESTNVEEDADPEERAKALLRDKYGMKTLSEQQLDAKQLEARKEQRKKLDEWKKKAEQGEDFDIMSMLPAPVLIAIDRFLKFGTALCTVAFVSAGVLITVEAWSKASNSPLPENVDSFIVGTVEPNFTPGLFVLLGFSVSLGVFAALQLGSQGSTYKED